MLLLEDNEIAATAERFSLENNFKVHVYFHNCLFCCTRRDRIHDEPKQLVDYKI